MLQSILWQLIWLLVRIALDVTKDMVLTTIRLVTEAETKTHEDGSPWTGPEKKSYVFNGLVQQWSQEKWAKIIGTQGQSTVNLLIETAVNYIKSLKK